MRKFLAAIFLAAALPLAAAQTEAPPAVADTTPAPVSYLTGMKLLAGAVRPSSVEAQATQAAYITQLSSIMRDFYGAGNYCSTGELLAWELELGGDSLAVVEGMMKRFEAFGYQYSVDWEEPGLIIFTSRNKRMNIFGAWGVYDDGAMLIWCRAEGDLR